MSILGDSTPGSEAKKASLPRTEGKVWPWAELTDQQRNAALQGFEVLTAIAEKAQSHEPAGDSSVTLFDAIVERHNQVVLLGGSRGSGKTALLLTMIDALRNDVYWTRNNEGTEVKQELTSPIYALNPLHLRGIPEQAPLALTVVQQLCPLVDKLCTDSCAGWTVGGDKDELRAAWKRLLRAAVAWHGANDRASRVDPETFEAELEEAERDRRSLPKAVEDFIPKLCERLQQSEDRCNKSLKSKRGSRPKALLVLSIDDADLNPGRVHELLNLTRQLTHPQLALLLAGDLDLFSTMLTRYFADEILSSPLRAGIEYRETQVVELARDALEKIVPREHRCSIYRMPRADRTSWIERSLSNLTIGTQEHEIRLRALFDLVPWLEDALPDNLRRLVSLRAQLSKGRSDGSFSLPRALVELAIETVHPDLLDETVMSGLRSYVSQAGSAPPECRLSYREKLTCAEKTLVRVRDGQHVYELVGVDTKDLRPSMNVSGHYIEDARLRGSVGAMVAAMVLAWENEGKSITVSNAPPLLKSRQSLGSVGPEDISWPAPKAWSLRSRLELENRLLEVDNNAEGFQSKVDAILFKYVTFLLKTRNPETNLRDLIAAVLEDTKDWETPFAVLASPEFMVSFEVAEVIIRGYLRQYQDDPAPSVGRLLNWRSSEVGSQMRAAVEQEFRNHPWFTLVEDLRVKVVAEIKEQLANIEVAEPRFDIRNFGDLISAQPELERLPIGILDGLLHEVAEQIDARGSIANALVAMVAYGQGVEKRLSESISVGATREVTVGVPPALTTEAAVESHLEGIQLNLIKWQAVRPTKIREVTPLESTLVAFAHNVNAFAEGSGGIRAAWMSDAHAIWWNGLVGSPRLAELRLAIGLPLPNWRDAMTWQFLCAQWNEEVTRTAKQVSPLQRVDHLAAWLLKFVYRRIWSGDTSTNSVVVRIASHAQHPRYESSRDMHAYWEWTQFLCLFAAPESPVSRQFAEVVIAAIQSSDATHCSERQTEVAAILNQGRSLRNEIKSLVAATKVDKGRVRRRSELVRATRGLLECRQKLQLIEATEGQKQLNRNDVRLERLVAAGVPVERATRALAAFDASGSEHPWYSLFGRVGRKTSSVSQFAELFQTLRLNIDEYTQEVQGLINEFGPSIAIPGTADDDDKGEGSGT